MNKKQYLDALGKELAQRQVPDADEVLADYEAHFARKALDGYTEEEIAQKLGNPVEIAADFLPASGAEGDAPTAKGRELLRLALVLSDVFAVPFFLLLFVWAAALAVCSLVVFALGVYLALGLSSISFIPVLTTAGGILLGLSILTFAVLLFMGFLWCLALAMQMTRAYCRWHGNQWYAKHELPLPVMPQLAGKRRRNTRSIVLIALICFVVLFAAAYTVLSLQAGALGFWHQWHWFETA